jgi:hypothetical protein
MNVDRIAATILVPRVNARMGIHQDSRRSLRRPRDVLFWRFLFFDLARHASLLASLFLRSVPYFLDFRVKLGCFVSLVNLIALIVQVSNLF